MVKFDPKNGLDFTGGERPYHYARASGCMPPS